MLNKYKRPKPILKRTKQDIFIDFGTISILVLSAFWIISAYDDLPDIIPTHFDLSGEPDKFGEKTSIWFLLVVSFVLCIGLRILSRFPHYLSYLTEITEDNAQQQYGLASSLLNVLAFLVSLIFFFAIYETIQVAHSNQSIIGFWHFLLTTLSFLIVLIIYLIKSTKKV